MESVPEKTIDSIAKDIKISDYVHSYRFFYSQENKWIEGYLHNENGVLEVIIFGKSRGWGETGGDHEMFLALMQRISQEKEKTGVRSVRSIKMLLPPPDHHKPEEFGMGTIFYNQYLENREGGMSEENAWKATSFGEIATAVGFTEVDINQKGGIHFNRPSKVHFK